MIVQYAVTGVLWLAFGVFGLSLLGQAMVRAALWARQRSVCSGCEYDLSGLMTTKCPECATSTGEKGPSFVQQCLVLLAACIVAAAWTGCCFQVWYRGSTLTYLLSSDRGQLPPAWSPLNPSWAWLAILLGVALWLSGLIITVYRARRHIAKWHSNRPGL